MFGFSFWKLLVLIVAIVGVWSAFRWFERAQSEKRRIAARQDALRAAPATGPVPGAQDTVACRVCGVFVLAQGARACARFDCPFPR